MYTYSIAHLWDDYKSSIRWWEREEREQKQIELSHQKTMVCSISDRISIPAWIWARCPLYPSSFGNLHAELAPQLRYTSEVMFSVKNENTWSNRPLTQSSLHNGVLLQFFNKIHAFFITFLCSIIKSRRFYRYSQFPVH